MAAMTPLVALLRAVNVGGTGNLPMAELKTMCQAIGFSDVRTYIASGNVIFRSDLSAPLVKVALEQRLLAYAGKPVGVIVRTAAQMREVSAANPFPDAPGSRVMALFLDDPVTESDLDGVTGLGPGEAISLGRRELYVHYGCGMADTRLRIPAAARGTVRNINTVARLAAMASERASGLD